MFTTGWYAVENDSRVGYAFFKDYPRAKAYAARDGNAPYVTYFTEKEYRNFTEPYVKAGLMAA